MMQIANCAGGIMASLEFEAIGADLSILIGEFGGGNLSFRVKLSEGETVSLSSGDSLENLEGRVTIKPNSGEAKEKENGIGSIWYFTASDDGLSRYPASYIVEAMLPPDQFIELVSAAQIGRIPSVIQVSAEGMSYDWQPDGSGKKWDNKESNVLPVTSINFIVPLVSSDQGELLEARLSDQLLPATRLQVGELAERLNSQITEIDKTLKYIFWAIIVLGGLLVIWKA